MPYLHKVVHLIRQNKLRQFVSRYVNLADGSHRGHTAHPTTTTEVDIHTYDGCPWLKRMVNHARMFDAGGSPFDDEAEGSARFCA